ncbi:hypothetical protein CFP65_4615 [Kitasatospora sp. MMS16-BH015]|uniref:serine hydrolase domain-containing protein n=1 Tax=Kitasatospora sp. MMS16-BH015 TaxID=2018025 RepID=UPI000CA3C89F|nr:serine hydrolase domain-containing protein [Kitasatospora sp. MMS16-BH015]AUG79351.1 hypothetical protein CFP65_4615 [Kitasatospora sp. MMS16-BH015]
MPTPVHSGLAALTRAAAPGAAVVLVLIGPTGSQVLCHGPLDGPGSPAVGPDTPFELGSVSKTFTALLLAEAAHRGEVSLADRVEVSGRPVSLLRLATHTAGLPRLPPGLLRSALPRWRSNPYAAYTPADLSRALGRTRLRRRPGLRYSNYGVGLLGRVLAERAGLDYPDLLAQRICGPLGLTATDCGPPGPGAAVGHRRGRPLPPWEIPALPGAGAVRSSGADLLRYLTAHLTPAGPLAPALREVLRPRVADGRTGRRYGLVWQLHEDDCHHSGATRGCTAFLALRPAAGTALAALTNSGPTARFLDAAYALLP